MSNEKYLKSIIYELLWFLKGDNNIKYLQENGVKIWDAWADENGDLGPVYGVQWRNFNGVDQINTLFNGIKNNPNSRRHILSAWNPAELDLMSLPACHVFSQFFVAKQKLSCQLYQRSCDMFLGVPFNIASYSLLTHLIAKECNLDVGEFVHTLGDYHIYHEHFNQVEIQLTRSTKKLPNLTFETKKIEEYKIDDFKLVNYDPHPKIVAEMNV